MQNPTHNITGYINTGNDLKVIPPKRDALKVISHKRVAPKVIAHKKDALKVIPHEKDAPKVINPQWDVLKVIPSKKNAPKVIPYTYRNYIRYKNHNNTVAWSKFSTTIHNFPPIYYHWLCIFNSYEHFVGLQICRAACCYHCLNILCTTCAHIHTLVSVNA